VDDSQNRIHVGPQHPKFLCPSLPQLPQPTKDHLPLYIVTVMPKHHQDRVYMRLLIAFYRVSVVLNPTLMHQIELQQRRMRNIISGHSCPAVVRVPEIRDKQVCLVSVFLQA